MSWVTCAHEFACVASSVRPRAVQSASLNVSSTCCELAAEDAVEPREAAALALEDEVRVVERRAVDDHVGLGLRSDLLQPLALRRASSVLRGEIFWRARSTRCS